MTVETQTNKVTVSGNGSTTSFSFSPMVIHANTELSVTHVVVATGVETAKTLTTDYTVTVASYPGTGTITYPVSGDNLATGENLIIKRVIVLEQTTDLENQGGYFPDTQETALDKTAMRDLQQQEEIDRCLKIPISEGTFTDLTIPDVIDGTAGDVMTLNTGKTGFIYATPNTSTYLTMPASSTDNAIARWDGTTGLALQDSSVTIDDNDLIQAPGGYGSTQGADIASATTVVVGTDGDYFDITGSTGPIGTFTVDAGRYFTLQFDSTPTLTHHATNLDLPGETDFTAAAGDVLRFYAHTANQVQCIGYCLATGKSVVESSVDLVNDTTPQLGGDLDCNGAQIQWSQGADVASDTALPVLTDGNYFDVTGTTTITSINTTGGAGTQIKLHFDGVLTLTHHATNLILPGGANITTAAGDEAEFLEYGAGTYRCTNYQVAANAPGGAAGLTKITSTDGSAVAAITFTGFDATKYKGYMWIISNITTATDNRELHARTSTNGGSGYDSGATDYAWAIHGQKESGTLTGEGSAGDAEIVLTGANSPMGTGTNESLSGIVWMMGPDVTHFTRLNWSLATQNDSGAFTTINGGAERQSAADVDAFEFIIEGGANFAAQGNITFYGIAI